MLMVESYDGYFRVSDELRPNGDRWFWVIGQGLCFPARDRIDAHRILEQKIKESAGKRSSDTARKKGSL